MVCVLDGGRKQPCMPEPLDQSLLRVPNNSINPEEENDGLVPDLRGHVANPRPDAGRRTAGVLGSGWGWSRMPEPLDPLAQSLLCVPESPIDPEKDNDGLVPNLRGCTADGQNKRRLCILPGSAGERDNPLWEQAPQQFPGCLAVFQMSETY